MATTKKTKSTSNVDVRGYKRKVKKKRPGIHSKNKAGRNKGSKNYLKKYRGQGK